MSVDFVSFKITRVCLTTCLYISGPPINDLTVASYTPFIFSKSRKKAALNTGQNCVNDAKTELGFFMPKRTTRVKK